MLPHLLVVTRKNKLNHNLLRLALLPTGAPLQFLEPVQLNKDAVEAAQVLIIDDQAIGSPSKLAELLGPDAKEKALVYLSRTEVPETFPKKFARWAFLPKPFHPRELVSLVRKGG